MFVRFEEETTVFYIPDNNTRIFTGRLMGSDGVRGVVDFGQDFGVAMPFLTDLYNEEVEALIVLERRLMHQARVTRAMIMLRDGSMEAATVFVKRE